MLSSTAEPADLNITGLPGFNAAFDQHPGFAAYRCRRLMPGRAAAMTDFVNLPTLRRLALLTFPWVVIMRLLGLEGVGRGRRG
jgi:hypothetical protein